MSEFVIRAATVADIPTLLRHRPMMWWDLGRHDEAALQLMAVAASEYFSTAVADGSYRGFLAETADGEVTGGAGIAISPWPGVFRQREPRKVTVLNVYTEPTHRRRGVARAVMHAVIAWCRDNGFVRIDLHASEYGRPLYEQLGFKPTNEMQLKFIEE